MEKEKIISGILEKVGNTDVSSQTVEAIMNLSPLADGAEPDDAYFEKMAGAVKSFQGNINHVFSEKLNTQVSQKIEEYKKSRTGKAEPTATESKPSDELNELKAQIKALQEARSEDLAKARRSDVERQVKDGLKERFRSTGMEVRDFFIDTALGKMDIPDRDANIDNLVSEAEKRVVRDMKAAGIDTDAPLNSVGGGGGNGKSWLDKKFAEKAKREGYAK